MRLRGDPPPDLVTAFAAALPGDATCHEGLVEIDGTAVAVRLLDDPRALPFGVPSRFEGCAPVSLGEGAHRLRDGPGLVLDRVRLSTTANDAPDAPIVTRVRSSRSDDTVVDVAARGRTAMILGQSYDPSWKASIDGRDPRERRSRSTP